MFFQDVYKNEEPVKEEPVDPTKFRINLKEEGSGKVPQKGSQVTAYYTGKLLDGTVFDSTDKRGPFKFTLGRGQVIKCWDEGFAQMKKGAKATLHCPPDYAYGSRGAGGLIPPNATLTFEVELLDFTQ